MVFYENVFDVKSEGITAFADAPKDPKNSTTEVWKDLIINVSITIEGVPVMFSDVPDEMEGTFVKGNNVSLVINTDDEVKLERIFASLSKYGMVVDKFGINWMLNYTVEL